MALSFHILTTRITIGMDRVLIPEEQLSTESFPPIEAAGFGLVSCSINKLLYKGTIQEF